MKTVYRSVGLLLLIAAFVVVPTHVAAEKQKFRFTVTLSPSLFDLEKVWVAAKEVQNLTPGKSIEINADDIASPAPLSTARMAGFKTKLRRFILRQNVESAFQRLVWNIDNT